MGCKESKLTRFLLQDQDVSTAQDLFNTLSWANYIAEPYYQTVNTLLILPHQLEVQDFRIDYLAFMRYTFLDMMAWNPISYLLLKQDLIVVLITDAGVVKYMVSNVVLDYLLKILKCYTPIACHLIIELMKLTSMKHFQEPYMTRRRFLECYRDHPHHRHIEESQKWRTGVVLRGLLFPKNSEFWKFTQLLTKITSFFNEEDNKSASPNTFYGMVFASFYRKICFQQYCMMENLTRDEVLSMLYFVSGVFHCTGHTWLDFTYKSDQQQEVGFEPDEYEEIRDKLTYGDAKMAYEDAFIDMVMSSLIPFKFGVLYIVCKALGKHIFYDTMDILYFVDKLQYTTFLSQVLHETVYVRYSTDNSIDLTNMLYDILGSKIGDLFFINKLAKYIKHNPVVKLQRNDMTRQPFGRILQKQIIYRELFHAGYEINHLFLLPDDELRLLIDSRPLYNFKGISMRQIYADIVCGRAMSRITSDDIDCFDASCLLCQVLGIRASRFESTIKFISSGNKEVDQILHFMRRMPKVFETERQKFNQYALKLFYLFKTNYTLQLKEKSPLHGTVELYDFRLSFDVVERASYLGNNSFESMVSRADSSSIMDKDNGQLIAISSSSFSSVVHY